MNGFPQSASPAVQTSSGRTDRSRQPAEFIYQTVTLAAMLLLLGSLWLF
jgi:hypothetical protein